MKTQFTALALLVLFVIAEVNAKTLSPPVITNDTNAPQYLLDRFGRTVIQSDKGDLTRIKSCGKTGSPDNSRCFYFTLEPTSNDHSEHSYKARLELNINLPNGQLRTPQKGQTYTVQWYFYIDPKNVVTEGFFVTHQVLGEGFGPLISYGMTNGKYTVDHITPGNAKGGSQLASANVKDMMGKWVLATEKFHLESKENGGWYETTLTDASTGKVLVQAPRKNLDMWGQTKIMHVKFGIYRRKGDDHHTHWPTSHVAFSDFKMTKL